MIGKTLAHYEILAKLGAGGMGEVYRARDPKLDREVAIKVLPMDMASDQERMARFRREAKVLASLNSPNIAHIHGFEEDQGTSFLVMELADGEDLAARIERGAIPMEEALDIARQIAEGLEEAHEKGVVHRDLKPANVMLSPEGKVKVLDFGLARAYAGEGTDEEDSAMSPTITAAMTQAGTILGTAAYMSPEQARGKGVDRRADLWAFGVIFWEMLTGRLLFQGETVSDTLAAVLRADPAWDELPEETPAAVRRLLERCLERDPRKRLRDIGEAWIRLERWKADPSTLHDSGASMLLAVEPEDRRAWVPWTLAAVAALIAILAWLPRGKEHSEPTPSLRLQVQLPDMGRLHTDLGTNVLVSPDGDEIAYLAGGAIHLRRLDQDVVRTLAGTEGASLACYSPDGQWIAFTAGSRLKRVSVTGGSPIEICEIIDSRGICWVNETTLVFTPNFSTPLQQVSLSDGISRPLTTLDAEAGERSHRRPQPLPDGNSVLFSCQFFNRDYDQGDIEIVRLDTGERTKVYRGGAAPRYADSGHLLFARDRTIFAIPVELETGTTSGLAVPVLDQVWTSVTDQEADDGSIQLSLSRNGTVVYRSATTLNRETRLAWLDMQTGQLDTWSEQRLQIMPLLSPDQSQAAIMRLDGQFADLWVIDLEARLGRRLTFTDRSDALGAWSPDGEELYFSRPDDASKYTIYRQMADGSGPEQRVTEWEGTINANSVSPDGKWLLAGGWAGPDIWDVILVDLETGAAAPFVGGPDQQFGGFFSPDGMWVVYVETRGPEFQVLIRAFPDTGAQWEVLGRGSPVYSITWSTEGDALYIRDEVGFHRIPLRLSEGSVVAGRPELLRTESHPKNLQYPTSAMHPDGERALVLVSPEGMVADSSDPTPQLMLITNWLDELARLAPLEE